MGTQNIKAFVFKGKWGLSIEIELKVRSLWKLTRDPIGPRCFPLLVYCLGGLIFTGLQAQEAGQLEDLSCTPLHEGNKEAGNPQIQFWDPSPAVWWASGRMSCACLGALATHLNLEILGFYWDSVFTGGGKSITTPPDLLGTSLLLLQVPHPFLWTRRISLPFTNTNEMVLFGIFFQISEL